MDRHAGPGARRPAARLGAAAGGAARAPSAASRLAEPGGDFPDPPDHQHASAGAGGARRARSRQTVAGYVLEAPDGLVGASFYLDEASVTGTETALIAAAAAPRHDRDSPRRLRAARHRAVRVPVRRWASRVEGIGTPEAAGRRRSPAARRGAPLRGDYIEAGTWAVLGAVTGGAIEVERRASRRHGADRRRHAADAGARASSSDDALDRLPVDAARRPAGSRPASGRASRATW